MTREEHIEKIYEIVKVNRELKTMLGEQNNILSAMRDYTSADVNDAYQRGLNKMWDVVRHLWENGTIDFSWDLSWSAEKVLEEYEQQKNAIKIGDEVKFNHDDIKATVMDQSDKEGMWWLYTENGCIEEWQDAYFRKTGRTFPQIAEVLKAMQER